MQVGVYVDGRVLTYSSGTADFAVGGTPVTLEQVLEFDAFGQITWVSDETRAWAYELKPWADAAAAEALAVKAQADHAAATEAKSLAKAQAKAVRAERAEAVRELMHDMHVQSQWGIRNAAMICPHCQVKGSVHTKSISQKKGISGGKATAAVLTGGVSLLATGLSRKEPATQAHCENCGGTWCY